MRSFKFLVLLTALSAGAWMMPQEAYAQQSSVSFQLFYDELSPYGMWVDYPNYGYVWIPDGDPEFSPYATAGHWILTDDGWTWVSDYPWGWAPFHYGRWDYDDGYGWFWVPDNEWGPAWVSWRRSPGYYGWAPMRPGISINIAFGRDYHERNERWNFVRERDITRPDIGRRYVNRTENAAIINRSTVIVDTRKDPRRNVTYMAGPTRGDVQKATGTTVKSVVVRDDDKPGHRLTNDALQIYRPQVQSRSDNGQNPAPSKVTRLNDVKPVSERKPGIRQRDANPAANSRQDQQPEVRPVNPSGNKVKEKQPQNVASPIRIQPQPSREVAPSDNKGRERAPQNVAPPNRTQPQPPREVTPPANRGRERAPQNVTPPNRTQPPQPRNVTPANKNPRPEPQNIAPPKKEQPPQKVAQPSKNREEQPSQPRPNQEQQDKKKREEK